MTPAQRIDRIASALRQRAQGEGLMAKVSNERFVRFLAAQARRFNEEIKRVLRYHVAEQQRCGNCGELTGWRCTTCGEALCMEEEDHFE